MASFLIGAALVVLVMVALGLFRVFRGPDTADRLMAAQLLGTGGSAVLLLLSAARHSPAFVDLAVILALLAAVTPAAFARGAARPKTDRSKVSDHQ